MCSVPALWTRTSGLEVGLETASSWGECMLRVNAHQVPKKEMPPTIRRLVENFALCRIGPKPRTTVLSKSVGRAFALS